MKFLSSDAGTDTLVVCLPPGGRGASAFQHWRTLLPGSAQLAVVQPPGREERFAEPAVTDVAAYTSAVSERVAAVVDGRRLVLVGACLGGMLAYEVARRLLASEVRVDLLCAIAAVPPSAYRVRAEPRSTQEGLELLREWAGTPAEVLDNPEFGQVLLPAIMADLALGDGYDGLGTPPLPVPVLAVGGSDDVEASEHVMSGWAESTSARLVRHTRQGDHFLHRDDAAWLVDRVMNLLHDKETTNA